MVRYLFSPKNNNKTKLGTFANGYVDHFNAPTHRFFVIIHTQKKILTLFYKCTMWESDMRLL